MLLAAILLPPGRPVADPKPTPPPVAPAPPPPAVAPAADGSGGPGPPSIPAGASAPPRSLRGSVALPIGEVLGVQLVTMGFNRYIGDAPWAEVSVASVRENLSSPWILDDDAFWVNQGGHAYQGSLAFSTARSAGLGYWGAAPFAFGASALWELAGETERPSLNDQVTTAVAGMVFGEVLHRLAGALLAEGGGWRLALASVLSPVGAINHGALGYPGAGAAPPSRWQLALGAVTVEGMGTARGPWEPLGYMGLAMTYGLPGSPDLVLDAPFDHFVLEGGYGLASDPVATVRARGLLAGRTFHVDPVRGLFGLYLSFGIDTPPRHQVSTSAVGFGGSARWDVGGGLALEGDAIASAVLLGAGSRVDRGPDAGERDYRFGPGQEGYAAVRLLGRRATAGFALRQHYLVGAGPDAGATELLLEGSATGLLRIAGPHGVGLELSRSSRWISPGGAPAVHGVDSVVRVYYSVHGGSGDPR